MASWWTVTRVAQSHIEGNVPKGGSFDEFLERDLSAYFCGTKLDCCVEYEFLRNGPTQTGISYPKYYLWVKSFSGDKLRSQGAARIAAMDQSAFDVTDFLSVEDIVESPDNVGGVFPAALVDKIVGKAKEAKLQNH